MRKTKYYIVSAVLIGLMAQVGLGKSGQILGIENQYSNQLLKLNVDKSKNGDNVDITVFTSKPYKIKLNPIKRAENEYVIFLPETYHSITAKPDVSSTGDSIQDIDVKLVPYMGSQANNGYTKITIKTKKNDVKLNVNSELSAQNTELDDELSQIMASQTKKHENTVELAKRKSDVTINNKFKKSAYPVKSEIKNNKIVEIKKPAMVRDNKINKAYTRSKKVQHNEIIVSKKMAEPTKDEAVVNKIADQKVEQAKPSVIDKPAVQNLPQTVAVVNSPKDNVSKAVSENVNGVNQSKTASFNNFLNTVTHMPVSLLILIFAALGVTRLIRILKARQVRMSRQVRVNNTESVNKSENILSRLTKPVSSKSVNEYNEDEIYPEQETSDDFIESSQDYTEILPDELEEEYIGYIPDSDDDFDFDAVEVKNYQEEAYTFEKVLEEEEPRYQEQISDDIDVIEGVEIADNKGIYLVQFEEEKALIGIVNSEIYLLNKFTGVSNPNFQVQKAESRNGKDLFYVKVDNWQGLVSSEQEKINLELVL